MDEKIKLWLFLPGRHSVVSETAQPAVNKLRAPGNSEEVAAALTEALRNSLERSLKGLSYARFGDVFTKYNPPTRNQNSFRYMRNLCSDDIEKVLSHSPHSIGEGLPVVVAPSGMLGRLVGCCPSDLVRQVYSSKSSAPNFPGFTQPTICQLRGQSYYVEVALGFPAASADKFSELENKQIKKELDSVKDPQSDADGQKKLESPDSLPVLERTFIYPPEAVLVPMVHQAFVRFSSKRKSVKPKRNKLQQNTALVANSSAGRGCSGQGCRNASPPANNFNSGYRGRRGGRYRGRGGPGSGGRGHQPNLSPGPWWICINPQAFQLGRTQQQHGAGLLGRAPPVPRRTTRPSLHRISLCALGSFDVVFGPHQRPCLGSVRPHRRPEQPLHLWLGRRHGCYFPHGI
ncbi:hypothetical protein PR202_ga31146 [Eleusine coracana subsp. coracana]|uniref:Mediator of RNA polymerase II transcription subunit 13 n=1 Tax=Eleusine coracana subsp. coracana TaxID=191504 RepID=A0AAV5DR57_ELECO|nr:hypothetical protein PR202_ga31146 [Eleusine coracana subsp. coracana]